MNRFRAILGSILNRLGVGHRPPPVHYEDAPSEMRDEIDSLDRKTFDWLARTRAATDGAGGTGSHA